MGGMSLPAVMERMRAVDAVRAIQRQWVKDTRESVAQGGPFAICNGDECEELFIALGVPVLAINYWNYLILAQGKRERMTELLNEAGYPGDHFFGFALAASLSPADAPWGGLPHPTLICASTRSDMETRVCELWAEREGCDSLVMDFSFPAPPFEPLPQQWWVRLREDWETMLDPDRLDYRVAVERDLIGRIEAMTGRSLAGGALAETMARINTQMALWAEAQQLIAQAPRCPVHIRDQISMYQAMWHRGTQRGIDLIRDYRDETAARVVDGVGAYADERFRLYYSVQVPPWHAEIEERYGAVAVCCSYSNVPDLYWRKFDPADPLRALAARHMMLFSWGPERIIDIARRHRCDAAIVVEPSMANGPSEQSRAVEAAGIPYCAIPRPTDDEEVRGIIARFIETRLC